MKAKTIETDKVIYEREAVKTHILGAEDKLEDVLSKYVAPRLKPGDIVFISEKAVACMQGRAVLVKDIKPSRAAKFLCKFVYKNPHGIGLSIPETMEMAIREKGLFKILCAAFLSALGKLVGKRGVFYNVLGQSIRSIDGPAPDSPPPINESVVLGAKNPDETAKNASEFLGCPFYIVDANDLGVNIIGSSHGEGPLIKCIIRDTPLGQGDGRTPIGIIRKVSSEAADGTEQVKEQANVADSTSGEATEE